MNTAASPTPPPVTIAIIGFSGVIGTRHTEHVIANPATDLVALVDPSPRASVVAAEYVIPYFEDIGSMLASRDIVKPVAALVCTPNHTHVPLSLQLVEAGIHVLVEKPISADVESGLKLVKRAREKGVGVLVGHHRRFNPYVMAAKKAVDSGLLGDVTAISALWTAFKPDAYFDADPALAWRKSKKGGGVVLINLIHEIDILHHLFGPIIRIHAEKTVSRRQGGEDGAEEGAALTLRFKSGVVGTYILSDAVVSPHFFEAGTGENPLMPRARRPHGEELDVYRIFGTEGTLSVPDMTLWKYEGESSWQSEIKTQKLDIDDDQHVPFERQLDHFVRVMRGEEEPSCSGEDAVRALAVCEAVRGALDDGFGTVTVPEHVGI